MAERIATDAEIVDLEELLSKSGPTESRDLFKASIARIRAADAVIDSSLRDPAAIYSKKMAAYDRATRGE